MKVTLSLVVIAVVTLACGCSGSANVTAPVSETQIAASMMGKRINAFGDDAFLGTVTPKFQLYGANLMEEDDLVGALQLSGDESVQVYCFDSSLSRIIINAPHPMAVLNAPINVQTQCPNGFVLVGFALADPADIIVEVPFGPQF